MKPTTGISLWVSKQI